MKEMFKKYWLIMALLIGFLVFEGLIQAVLFAEQNNEVTQETDLGGALMGALVVLMCILLLYLFALICSVAAFYLATKKLQQEKSKSSVTFAILGGLAVLAAVLQAIVTVWNNADWIFALPQILA